MTKAEAHALLDAAIAGEPVSRAQIDAALRATGDLLPLQLFVRAAHEPTPEPAPPSFASQFLQVGTRVMRLAGHPAHRPFPTPSHQGATP